VRYIIQLTGSCSDECTDIVFSRSVKNLYAKVKSASMHSVIVSRGANVTDFGRIFPISSFSLYSACVILVRRTVFMVHYGAKEVYAQVYIEPGQPDNASVNKIWQNVKTEWR